MMSENTTSVQSAPARVVQLRQDYEAMLEDLRSSVADRDKRIEQLEQQLDEVYKICSSDGESFRNVKARPAEGMLSRAIQQGTFR